MHSTIQNKQQWHTALIAQGALLNDSKQIKFSTKNNDGHLAECFYLQHLSCIEIKGEDAFNFLQGQLSCDMSEITISQSGIGSHNNLKGRMLSSFRVIKAGDTTFYLIIDHSIAQTCVEQLTKYAVFSNISIAINDSKIALGCLNTSETLNIISNKQNSVTKQQSSHIIQINNDASRLMLIVDIEQCETVWKKLISTAMPKNLENWAYANIQEHLAWVTQETQDKFLPQSFNYHLIGGVSFKKGCYIGQEVIIRTQHRGALKRQLCFISIKDTQDKKTLSIGREMYCKDKAIGVIVASSVKKNQTVLLAVLHQNYIQSETIITDDQKNELNIIEISSLSSNASE